MPNGVWVLETVPKAVVAPVVPKEKDEPCLTGAVILVCPNLNALASSLGPVWNEFAGGVELVGSVLVLVTPNLNGCDDKPLVTSLVCCCACGKPGSFHVLFVLAALFDAVPNGKTAGSPKGLTSLRWNGDGGTSLLAASLAAAAAPLNEKPVGGLVPLLAWSPSTIWVAVAGAKGFDVKPLVAGAKAFGRSDDAEGVKEEATVLAAGCGPKRSSKFLLPDPAEDVSVDDGIEVKGGGLGGSLAAGVEEVCAAGAVLDGNVGNVSFGVSAEGADVENLKGLGNASLDGPGGFGTENEVIAGVGPNLKPVLLTTESEGNAELTEQNAPV